MGKLSQLKHPIYIISLLVENYHRMRITCSVGSYDYKKSLPQKHSDVINIDNFFTRYKNIVITNDGVEVFKMLYGVKSAIAHKTQHDISIGISKFHSVLKYGGGFQYTQDIYVTNSIKRFKRAVKELPLLLSQHLKSDCNILKQFNQKTINEILKEFGKIK